MAEGYEEINVSLPSGSATPMTGQASALPSEESNQGQEEGVTDEKESGQGQEESQQEGEQSQSIVGASCIIVFPKYLRGHRAIVKKHLAEMSVVATKKMLLDSPELKERGLKEGDLIHFYQVEFKDIYGAAEKRTLMRIEFAITNDTVIYNKQGEEKVGTVADIFPNPQMVLISSENEHGTVSSEFVNTNQISQVVLFESSENEGEEQEEEKEEEQEEEKEEESIPVFNSKTIELLKLVTNETYKSYGKENSHFYDYPNIFVLYFWYLYFNANFKLNAKDNFSLLLKLMDADGVKYPNANQEQSVFSTLVEADNLLFADVSNAISQTADCLKSPLTSDWLFDVMKPNKQVSITEKDNENFSLIFSKASESSFMVLLNEKVFLYRLGDFYNSESESVFKVANLMSSYFLFTEDYEYTFEGVEMTYGTCKKTLETFIKTI